MRWALNQFIPVTVAKGYNIILKWPTRGGDVNAICSPGKFLLESHHCRHYYIGGI